MDPNEFKKDDLDPFRGILNAVMILALVICLGYLAVMIFSS
jgi:hypothetical protein